MFSQWPAKDWPHPIKKYLRMNVCLPLLIKRLSVCKSYKVGLTREIDVMGYMQTEHGLTL